MGDNVMGSFRTNRPPRGRRLGRGRGFRTFRLVRRWFRHESGGIERIAWPLTGSVCSFIVRSIPEGLMFREFSSIWEIQGKRCPGRCPGSRTRRNRRPGTAGPASRPTGRRSFPAPRGPGTAGPCCRQCRQIADFTPVCRTSANEKPLPCSRGLASAYCRQGDTRLCFQFEPNHESS